ncbi:MAG: energy transducer TonB [Acidobacteriota bacterium]
MKYFTLTILFLILTISAAAQATPAKFLSGPEFAISAEDEAAGIGGTMKVAATVDKSGAVTRTIVFVAPAWPCSADVEKRVESVMKAAEEVVKKYKFSPAIENGKPVESAVGVSLPIGEAAREAKKPAMPADPNSSPVPRLIRGGVVNGKAKYLAKPAYPSAAREARADGSVNVEILIDEDGKVVTAQAIDGAPLLHFAARSAACQSTFAPTLLSGTPVKVSGKLTYNFVF